MNMGLAIPLLKKEYGWSSAQVGAITSALFWVYGFGHILWGRLGDKFGARILGGVGAISSMIINWIVSLGSSIFGLAFPWAVNGVAQSMVWSTGTGMVTRWWPKKERGRAMGIALFFTGGATVVVWLLVTQIAAPLWGWRGIFRFPVLFMGAMGIVYFFIVRDHPHDVGLKDYVEEYTETAEKEQQEVNVGLRPYLNCLRDKRLVGTFLLQGLTNFTRYAFLDWIPLYYMEAAKYNIAKMGWVSVSLPIGMAIGPLLAGFISDKIFKARRGPMIFVYCFCSAIVALVIGFTPPTHVAMGIIFLFLAGFFIIGSHGLLWALCTDLAGRRKASTAAGIMDWAAYMFAALNAVVIGKLLTVTHGNWPLAFGVVAGVSTTAGIIGLIMRR
jgi:OPA family glycerol-3-phosphate transporter-like MFS transporter